MKFLSDVQDYTFPFFEDKVSDLAVFEGENIVPFAIKRVFTIHAREQCTRGYHAHRACMQLLVVLSGQCEIVCDDGFEKSRTVLSHANQGLLIPATIWAEQIYEPNTQLMVLTDQPYDEDDYIRNYQEFIDFRNGK